MTARYLIRLDDACPTMDHHRWARLEDLLDRLGIRPIVAVVPDNQDADLQVAAPDPAFWDRVRAWRDKGWTIAMHGYQHRFHPVDRRRLLLPFYDRSEFAGLSLAEQAVKIRASWRIFQREGISPTVWTAPAHCFDRTTLLALAAETPIRIISDGIALDQFYADGFYWLPQQLWTFAEKDRGLWTVCLHPSSMNDNQFKDLEYFLSFKPFMSRIFSHSKLTYTKRKKTLHDFFYSTYFWIRHEALIYIQLMKNESVILAIRAVTSRLPRIKELGIILGWVANKFSNFHGSLLVSVFGSDMILSPSDYISRQLIFVPQWYDPEEIRFIKSILESGDQVVDVGANIGAYTLLFAKLVGPNGRVISIEADDENYKKLIANLELNKYINCTAINVGVSDKSDALCFYRNNSGNHGAHSFLMQSDINTGNVVRLHVKPLHEIIERKKFKFMKFDIEGFEWRVLREYLNNTTISLLPSYIMIEDEVRHREADAVALLTKNGYIIVRRINTNVILKLGIID